MHRSGKNWISGYVCLPSGLWHQKQANVHPLRNTVVRIPGPSWMENRWILKTLPESLILLTYAICRRKSTSSSTRFYGETISEQTATIQPGSLICEENTDRSNQAGREQRRFLAEMSPAGKEERPVGGRRAPFTSQSGQRREPQMFLAPLQIRCTAVQVSSRFPPPAHLIG